MQEKQKWKEATQINTVKHSIGYSGKFANREMSKII